MSIHIDKEPNNFFNKRLENQPRIEIKPLNISPDQKIKINLKPLILKPLDAKPIGPLGAAIKALESNPKSADGMTQMAQMLQKAENRARSAEARAEAAEELANSARVTANRMSELYDSARKEAALAQEQLKGKQFEARRLEQALQNAEAANSRLRALLRAGTGTQIEGDSKGYYRALGLNPNTLKGLSDAQAETILSGIYRAQAKVNHPDHGGNTDRMKSLNVAYEILSDPAKRRNYR